MAKIVLYLAASLDGFIADEHGGVDWLTPFQSGDLGFEAFLGRVGTVVMGRRTFDQARAFELWPYGGKRIIVLTSRPLGSLPDGGEVVRGEAGAIAAQLRENASDAWIVGGAKTMGAFLAADAIDRVVLHVAPLILGSGLRMFEGAGSAVPFHLEDSTLFRNGVARLTYERTWKSTPLRGST